MKSVKRVIYDNLESNGLAKIGELANWHERGKRPDVSTVDVGLWYWLYRVT